MLSVVCGTARKRSFGINLPVSRQTPYLLNVWDVETGKPVRSVPLPNALYSLRSALGGFTQQGTNVTDVHFTPDNKKLSLNLNDRFRVLDVESGRMVAYGPVRDQTGSWGLGVIESSSEDEVRQLVDGDPAVTSGMARMEYGPMLVSIVRV